jgi:hypothetical protein
MHVKKNAQFLGEKFMLDDNLFWYFHRRLLISRAKIPT